MRPETLFSHHFIKEKLRFLTFFSFVILNFSFCENPFFPPTGKPVQSFAPRANPQETIKQLIEAYESKRLDLYTDLLSDSFQFYVAPSFFEMYSTKYNYDCELPDTNLHFVIDRRPYYYWKKKEEIASHRNLFSNSNTISFSQQLEILDTYYTVNGSGDSILAEIKTSGGEISIDIDEGYRIVKYTVEIEKQVFLMEKDSEGKWLIKKWFDLSDAPSVIN